MPAELTAINLFAFRPDIDGMSLEYSFTELGSADRLASGREPGDTDEGDSDETIVVGPKGQRSVDCIVLKQLWDNLAKSITGLGKDHMVCMMLGFGQAFCDQRRDDGFRQLRFLMSVYAAELARRGC